MNKLSFLFLIIPFCTYAMHDDKPADFDHLCKKIGAREYRFERAKHWIELMGNNDPRLKAFARTFLRVTESRNFKTYKQMHAVLEQYKTETNDAITFSFIDVMHAVIDNWQTDNPVNLFKNNKGENQAAVCAYAIKTLGLQEPK